MIKKETTEMIGKKYDRLTALELVSAKSLGKSGTSLYVKCACDCGKEIYATTTAVRTRNTKSCGCLRKDVLIKRNTDSITHGCSKERIYNIWRGMIGRCKNNKNIVFKYYGQKGIKVHNSWLDFLSFKKWALKNGYNDKLTIDRKDYNGNYTPSNCRWITQAEQTRNTRSNRLITIDGETKCLADWATESGINYITILSRLNRGMNPKDAVSVRRLKRAFCVKVFCVEKNKTFETISVAAKELGLHKEAISACINGRAKSSGGLHFEKVIT